MPLLKLRRPQVFVAVGTCAMNFSRPRCRAATKRLLKMLERKRVEANCVRMVQGTALSAFSDGIRRICHTTFAEASTLVTKILTVNAALEAELQVCEIFLRCVEFL